VEFAIKIVTTGVGTSRKPITAKDYFILNPLHDLDLNVFHHIFY
jgi:hypothetical protein